MEPASNCSKNSANDRSPHSADQGKRRLESSTPSKKGLNVVSISGIGAEINNELSLIGSASHSRSPPKVPVANYYDNAPDGGWGWVVTFAAFMASVILDGISFSFGLFFKELLIHFNEGKSLTSWVISVFNGTYLTIGPVASILVNKFGCRRVAVFGALISSVSLFLSTFSPNIHVMIVLFGLLGGIGQGLLYIPAIVTVGHYFKKKRALATGIAVSGSGIGGFVFGPLSEFLIDQYTWQGAMWIIAGIVLNGIPIGALLRPLGRSEASSSRSQSRELRCSQCCQRLSFSNNGLFGPTFTIYLISCFVCTLGFYIPFTYLPDLADELGMTSQQGAMLIAIIGISNVVSRVGGGWLADRSWTDALMINSVVLVIGGVATVCIQYYRQYWTMATYCFVFGNSIAIFVSYQSIILADLLGIDKLTSSFGVLKMSLGVSTFIGAPSAGALVDKVDDYSAAFYFAGTAIALSGIVCMPLYIIRRRKSKRCQKYVISGSGT